MNDETLEQISQFTYLGCSIPWLGHIERMQDTEIPPPKKCCTESCMQRDEEEDQE